MVLQAYQKRGFKGNSRRSIEVQDFRSGQYAMVLSKQTAMVSAQGSPGLFLSGLGILNPIEQGTPRSASVSPVPPETPQQKSLLFDPFVGAGEHCLDCLHR